jgi:hypothetical protein
MVACAHPDNYQRLLKPELDPEPWRYLYPLFVKSTPTEVISMHRLVEAISAATVEVHPVSYVLRPSLWASSEVTLSQELI